MTDLHSGVCKGVFSVPQPHQPQLLWSTPTHCTPVPLWRASASSGTLHPGLLLSTPNTTGTLCPSHSGAPHPPGSILEHPMPPRTCAPALLRSTPDTPAAMGWLQSALALLRATPKHPPSLCALALLQSAPDPRGVPVPQPARGALQHPRTAPDSHLYPAPRLLRSPPTPPGRCSAARSPPGAGPKPAPRRPRCRRLRYETRAGRGGAGRRRHRPRALPPPSPRPAAPGRRLRRDRTGEQPRSLRSGRRRGHVAAVAAAGLGG